MPIIVSKEAQASFTELLKRLPVNVGLNAVDNIVASNAEDMKYKSAALNAVKGFNGAKTQITSTIADGIQETK